MVELPTSELVAHNARQNFLVLESIASTNAERKKVLLLVCRRDGRTLFGLDWTSGLVSTSFGIVAFQLFATLGH